MGVGNGILPMRPIIHSAELGQFSNLSPLF